MKPEASIDEARASRTLCARLYLHIAATPEKDVSDPQILTNGLNSAARAPVLTLA